MTSAPKIFKAYDIRGVYPTELDEGLAYLIGRAVVVHTNAKRVLVGRDMRVSSIPMRDALVRGIREQGADVVDVGLCSSPMFYWATQGYGAGVMVTASHNPAKYNGFKICKDGAFPVGEISGMQEIEQLVLGAEFPAADRVGTYEEQQVLEDFLAFSLSFLKTDRPFKIVVDAANGMGGYIYGEVISRLPPNIHLVPMFFEPDGNFPNHEANPLKPETCKQLQERVILENADLGVALDGDEDRIFFIDNEGTYITGDLATALLCQEILAEKPGSTILYDVRQSRITPETVESLGGKPYMVRVGHAMFKVAMVEQKAAWGGESSGHFFNAEQQNTENTLMVLFRLLNLLAQRDQTLSQAIEPLRKYAKLTETNFEVNDAKSILAKIEQQYAPGAKTVSHLDGLRIDFDDWWFNVRVSNTEPVMRLNLECRNDAALQQRYDELSRMIGGKVHH